MIHPQTLRAGLCAILMTGLCGLAVAQPASSSAGSGQKPAAGQGATAGGGERPRHGPPPEAIDACKGKAANAACTFTGRQGEKLTGTCFKPPEAADKPMACRPAGAPAGGPGGPGGQGQSGGGARKP